MGEQVDMNPNENIVAEDKVMAGSGGVTFDDLEKIMDAGEKSEPKAKPKSEPKAKAKDSKVEEDSDDEGSEESEEDDSDDEAGEEKEALRQSSPDSSVKGKKVKGTLGGESVEIHTGAMIPVKIDGHMVPVAIQTLVNNFSGKQAWDKKFSELDNDRQDFLGRVSGLDSFVQGIFDKAEEIESSDDPVATSFEVLKMIGQLAGRDPKAMMDKINSGLSNDYDQVSGMSEIEKENWDLKRKLKIDSLDKDLDIKLSQKATANAETARAEKEVLGRYKITDAERQDLTAYLKANKFGTTLKDVVELKVVSTVTNTVQKYNKDLLQDKELLDTFIDKCLKDPTFSEEDILEVLTSVFSEDSSSGGKEDDSDNRLSRKLGKTGQATKKKPATAPKTKRVSRSEELWDSL